MARLHRNLQERKTTPCQIILILLMYTLYCILDVQYKKLDHWMNNAGESDIYRTKRDTNGHGVK